VPLVWGGAADDVLQAIEGPTEAAGAICSAGEGPYRAGAFIRLPASHRSPAVGGVGSQSALGHRFMVPVGRSGWVADAGAGHGLPYAGIAGLAAVPQWPSRNRIGRTGVGADCQIRQSGPPALADAVAVG
jgi:hypothetical protein